MHLIALIIISISFNSVKSWDLSTLGIKNSTFSLRHVTLYHMRAFLTITAQKENKYYGLQIPTLIESTWPENVEYFCPHPFPSLNDYSLDAKACSYIQQAGYTEIDENGRIWILDIGNDYCSPKLLSYDLQDDNKEFHRTTCKGFNHSDVTSMKLSNFKPNKLKVYFTMSHGEFIMMYDLQSKKWNNIYFSENDNLVIPKASTTQFEGLKINEIAMIPNKAEIYVSDFVGNLYFGILSEEKNSSVIKVLHLGNLMGKTKSITFDKSGNIYYVLPQYGTVLRCNLEYSKELSMDKLEVLKMTNHEIVQIFFGITGSVWTANEQSDIYSDHCEHILSHFSRKSEYDKDNDNVI